MLDLCYLLHLTVKFVSSLITHFVQYFVFCFFTKELHYGYGVAYFFLFCKLSAVGGVINPLNAEFNPICYLLALLGAHHFLHVSSISVKLLTFRRLMSYIYIWSTHS